MGKEKKEKYAADLRDGKLNDKYISDLKALLEKHLKLEEIPDALLRKTNITKSLTRLPLYIAKGNKGWQGLVVCFPGNAEDMTTSNVGTPFLRIILYPILELFQEVNKYLDNKATCIYFLGARFPDVFIRKFKLLSLLTPRVIVLTNDLLKTIREQPPEMLKTWNENNESLYQQRLCKAMNEKSGLSVPTTNGRINIGYISYEVQTAEGTLNPERLDILGYDLKDHSLVAFELKGPSCGSTQFQNLLLQGLEHRNWLENNKMAIKLIKEGPRGRKINIKKRVRLILGFCSDEVPRLFYALKDTIEKKDKYLKIDFVNVELNNDKVKLFKVD